MAGRVGVVFSFGQPDGIGVVARASDGSPIDVSAPLGASHIEVEVRACSLSETDLNVRRGSDHVDLLKAPEVAFTADMEAVVPGYACAGVVSAVGADVDDLRPGAPVVGLLPVDGFGACSDFVTAPRAFFTRLDLPRSAAATAASTAGNDDAHAAPATTGDPILSHVEAAALLVPGVLAITGLHGHAHIQAGETALVLNADRSEGSVAMQLAIARGMRVIAVPRRDHGTNSAESIRSAAAATTGAVMEQSGSTSNKTAAPAVGRLLQVVEAGDNDSLAAAVVEAVGEETDGLGADVVIDCGSDVLGAADIVACLGSHGRWVCSRAGLDLGQPDTSALFAKSASLSFNWAQTWVLSGTALGRLMHVVAEAMALGAAGVLVAPGPSLVLPLDQLRDGHEAMEAGEAPAGVVIRMTA